MNRKEYSAAFLGVLLALLMAGCDGGIGSR